MAAVAVTIVAVLADERLLMDDPCVLSVCFGAKIETVVDAAVEHGDAYAGAVKAVVQGDVAADRRRCPVERRRDRTIRGDVSHIRISSQALQLGRRYAHCRTPDRLEAILQYAFAARLVQLRLRGRLVELHDDVDIAVGRPGLAPQILGQFVRTSERDTGNQQHQRRDSESAFHASDSWVLRRCPPYLRRTSGKQALHPLSRIPLHGRLLESLNRWPGPSQPPCPFE